MNFCVTDGLDMPSRQVYLNAIISLYNGLKPKSLTRSVLTYEALVQGSRVYG